MADIIIGESVLVSRSIKGRKYEFYKTQLRTFQKSQVASLLRQDALHYCYYCRFGRYAGNRADSCR
jgi:hypothetical protein